MDVKVTIDISDRLHRIAIGLLNALTVKIETEEPTQIENTPEKASERLSDSVKAQKGTDVPPSKEKAVKSDIERVKEMPGGEELVEKLDLEVAEITDGELRAALDECRHRLLGDKPKKNPQYSALTGYIRNLTAIVYSAGVPSDIPTDLRPAFVRDLQAITTGSDGNFMLPGEEAAPF